MDKLISIIKLCRPQQWIKNTFLFLPIFFAGQFFNTTKLIDLVIGFIAFSVMSSAVYILNDYRDIEADKIHPKKMYRPLAAGKVSVSFALTLMLLFSIAGLGVSYYLNPQFCYLLAGYVGINIAYSLGLKNVAIIDLLLVATGFVLRTIAGGVVADVFISHWLVIMIFLLSFFLVVAKRREDLIEFTASGKKVRKSVENYNLDFINLTLTMLSAVIIVSYIMYTVSPEVNERLGSTNIYMTGIFVILGLMRYLQLTVVENKSGSPVRILYTDRFIHLTLAGWIISFFLIIYFK